ncbi:MAG: hypothetical protein CMK32_06885 [Porticoccaceae bacterium]|nr:hypothetical protein [Porticoccaceae bacterium]
MSIIKRLSATLVSRIDQAVAEIENHDAVIQASLKELAQKTAAAKVRLGQLHREQQQLRERASDLRAGEDQWHERALRCGRHDEDNALECLRRARQCRHEAERLDALETDYKLATEKLETSISTLEQRLADTRHQHTLLRARHSTQQAMAASAASPLRVCDELGESFARWEIAITEAELAGGLETSSDPLAQQFDRQEEEASLRAELNELMAGGIAAPAEDRS